MKANLPMPAIIGALVVVVAIVGFFFIRGMVVEPPTPRPDLYGGPRTDGAGASGGTKAPNTYPGQGGGGAVTPINPGGG